MQYSLGVLHFVSKQSIHFCTNVSLLYMGCLDGEYSPPALHVSLEGEVAICSAIVDISVDGCVEGDMIYIFPKSIILAGCQLPPLSPSAVESMRLFSTTLLI